MSSREAETTSESPWDLVPLAGKVVVKTRQDDPWIRNGILDPIVNLKVCTTQWSVSTPSSQEKQSRCMMRRMRSISFRCALKSEERLYEKRKHAFQIQNMRSASIDVLQMLDGERERAWKLKELDQCLLCNTSLYFHLWLVRSA
jgi:hypothetical protein